MKHMSVLLARPRLDEVSPSHSSSQLGQSITVFHEAVGRLLVRLQASPSHLSHGVPIAVFVSS